MTTHILSGRERTLIASALHMAARDWRTASTDEYMPEPQRADFARTADEAEKLAEEFET